MGATLIHLLTGISPGDLPQQDLRIQFADKVHSRAYVLVSWLQKITEAAPEKRFTSASAAIAALESGLAIKSTTSDLTRQSPEFVNNSGSGISNITKKVPE
ncbi:serine/threonine protein kinase [Richelia intracellularis]|nr:serine/threonine protein kinase [Richelia intracellularis]